MLAGALSVATPPHGPVLHRALIRLDANGTEMQRLVLPNQNPAVHHQDGCTGLALDGEGSFVVTGFVDGQNATTGYVDEPMFLIKGGRAFVAKVAVEPARMRVVFEKVLDDSGQPFRVCVSARLSAACPPLTLPRGLCPA